MKDLTPFPWIRIAGIFVFASIALNNSSAMASVWEGFYTDASSYAPGDTVEIHASALSAMAVQYRLLRLGGREREIARSQTVTILPQETKFGSFVDFPDVDLSAQLALTLEGWYLPTGFGGDDIVIAGQASANAGTIAIGIDRWGELYARLWTRNTTVVAKSGLKLTSALLNTWYHVAVSYDGFNLKLYINGSQAASVAATGPTATSSLYFRLGARAEAPGDMTGIIDGRLDSWAIWPRVLNAGEIGARYDLGLNQADPAPEPSSIRLYVDFEDDYGSVVSDKSLAGHQGTIVNHGTPRVAGVISGGHALRLNHDQVVDAGWPASAQITLPADAPSGLYAVQVLPGPDFESAHGPDVMRGFAVRPVAARAPIAVVLGTNTWNAYNGWPATDFWDGVTPAGMSERDNGTTHPIPGGNNSAYKVMGDGSSVARYHGWRRPNFEAGIAEGGTTGFFYTKAAKSVPLVRWLDEEGMSYDVYSDEDFALGRFPGFGTYQVLIFHGHDEYWSQAMLDTSHAFLNSGGSVLHLGGNAVTWVTVPAPGGLIEVHKYPVTLELGAADHFSGINGKRIGYWRAVSMCADNFNDVVFGTVNDEIGGPNCDTKPTDCLGLWQVDRANHWLWNGSGIAVGEVFGTSEGGGRSVGSETDVVVSGVQPPGLATGENVVVLAHGMEVGGAFPAVDHAVLASLSCTEMDDQAGELFGVVTSIHNSDLLGTSGSVAYYTHRSGGAVLSVSAIAAPSTLSTDPQAVDGDTRITDLSRRFLHCFAYGLGCPPGVGAEPSRPPSCTRHVCQFGATPNKSGCGCISPPDNR